MAGQEVGSAYVKVGSQPDSKFKSNIENAMPSGMKVGKSFVNGFKAPLSQLAGWFKGGAVIGAFSSITSAAMSSISASMDSAIARADTLANFPKVMQSLGYSADAASKSTEIMKEAVDGLPTRLQDMTNNVQVLAATMGNLADGEVNASTVGRAFNDMMLAGGQSTDIANNAFTQYSQMLAAGKVDQQAWNSVVMAAPGQVDQLAKSLLGASANQKTLYEALKTGKVSFDQFNAAVVKLDNEGGEGFASFREQAENASKGIATSMANAKNAISNQLANIIGKLNENGEIAGIFDGIKANINNFGAFFVSAIDTIKSSIDFEGFKAAFDGIGAAIAAAFGSEGAMSAADFGNLVAGAINLLIPVIQTVTPLISALASAFKFLCDNATWVVPALVGVVAGVGLVRGAMSAASLVKGFADGLTKVSYSAGPAGQSLTTMAGGLKAIAPSMVQVGVAVLAMGGGLLLAGAGFALLALSAIQLASAGPGAIAVMVGMVAAIAGLAAGAAFLGPALTVAAPGLIAFGVAVALVGAGIMLASAGIALLATQLPIIAAYGAAAGMASIMLGAGLMVLGAGALVAGAGCIVLGAGLAIASPGLVVASAAAVVLGAAMMLIGTGAILAGTGCMMMGVSLPLVASSAGPAAAGIGVLAAACLLAAPGLLAGAGPAAALAVALVPMGASALMAGVGLMMVCAALSIIADNAQPAGDGMKTLAQAATECGPQIAASAPAFLSTAQSVQMMATSTMSGAMSMGMLSSASASAAAAMMNVQQSASAAASIGAASLSTFSSTVTSSLSSAASSATTACASIKRAISSISSKTIKVNVAAGSVKLPHFSMSGSFNPQTGQVPNVSFRWYAKGGIFTKPTMFRGVGEETNEAVMPLQGHYMRPFAQAVAEEMDMGGGEVVNNYYNIRLAVDSSVGAKQITRELEREIRLHGMMKG